MSTLYLIRHGQASFGSADYDNLSALGRRQGRIVGAHFLRAGIHFNACWSGTLKRQGQTADAARTGFRQAGAAWPRRVETQAWNEYDYGAVLRSLVPIIETEDPSFVRDVKAMFANRRAFQTVFDRVMRRWAGGQDTIEGLPSWKAFCGQVVSGLESIMASSERGSHVAVFTSGGPIAACVGSVLELVPETTIALSWQLVNASVTRFKFSQGDISLGSFNEQGHLEGQGAENLVTYR